MIRVDEWLIDDFSQADIGEHKLGGHALTLGFSCQSRQAIAGLFLIRLGEHFAKIGEVKMLIPDTRLISHGDIFCSQPLANVQKLRTINTT